VGGRYVIRARFFARRMTYLTGPTVLHIHYAGTQVTGPARQSPNSQDTEHQAPFIKH